MPRKPYDWTPGGFEPPQRSGLTFWEQLVVWSLMVAYGLLMFICGWIAHG